MAAKTNHIEIQAHRTAYSAEDVRRTLTIRELIEALEEQADELGDDAPVYLSHDNGYTFGGIDLMLSECDDRGEVCLECVELREEVMA